LNPIKFGTDGWRAVIDKDFIPENICLIIQAFCDVYKGAGQKNKCVVVGYDRRLKSEESARLVSEVLAGNNFNVLLSKQFCPTPCVSWMVKQTKSLAGIVVTASHNPSEWNGIKFKEGYGGSASPEYTNKIESQIQKNIDKKRALQTMPFDEAIKEGSISLFDPHDQYARHLASLVDIQLIRKRCFQALFDPLFGSGTDFLNTILGENVEQIHAEKDHQFGGLNPEPIDKNLSALIKKVESETWDVGFSTDGDADRIGAVDENGAFVNSHQIFALLLKHYAEDRKLKGTIVKSVSTTQMINKLCARYRFTLIETPIGFKHICKKLFETNALMGGEESGGISYAPHIHERDGLLCALMLLEMMAMRQKSLRELIDELYSEIGSFYYNRMDLHLSKDKIRKMRQTLEHQKMTSLAGHKVQSTNFMDGFKYILDNEAWLLIRASGTEPLVRIYAEASTEDEVGKLLGEGERLVE
jgi:alpha-D-glucose phosphate-specific phosphoglucomutase